MAKCKFCGKEVLAARVSHAACFEREAERLAGEICDNFCKYTELLEQDQLGEVCKTCPLNLLVDLGV